MQNPYPTVQLNLELCYKICNGKYYIKFTEEDKCCEDFLHVSTANETCCGGSLIKSADKLCCENEIVNKKQGEANVCCGTSRLNKGKICCDGIQQDRFMAGEKQKENVCCGSNIIHPDESDKVCCRNTIHISNNSSDECCGDDLILSSDNHTQCCSNEGSFDPDFEGCCGAQGPYGFEDSCCSISPKAIITKKNPGQQDCCGGVPYNKNDTLCCGEKFHKDENTTAECCNIPANANLLKSNINCCGLSNDPFWIDWMTSNWITDNYNAMFQEMNCPSICPDGFALYATDTCFG